MDIEFKNLVEQFGTADTFPVITRIPADLITPFGAYLNLSEGAEYSFLFESIEGGDNLARYSFIGANPESIVSERAAGTRIKSANGESDSELPIFEYLRHALQKRKIATAENLPSFIGGAVGNFDFSIVKHFEPILNKPDEKTNSEESQSQFGIYKTIVAFDHARQQIAIITLVFQEPDEGKRRLIERLYAARRANSAVYAKLRSGKFAKIKTNQTTSSPVISSNWERTDFERSVEKIQKLISEGECYQVVLSQCFTRKTEASAESIYRALRSLNPSPYMILMKHGEKSIVGASPEMLVRCRNNKLEYRPIAGTRPRGENSEEDSLLADEMRSDEKEVSEHTMLVDLGRNDLGRVSKYASVEVRDLLSVEKFSHVQHLVSYLYSELREDCDHFDALASCFPAGTVTGAPKIRAIQLIEELEPTPRGIYSGAVGYIDYAGNLDTCIAIRTMELENGVAQIQSGAGIVADSIPHKEYEETKHKAQGLIKAIELAETGEYDLN